MSRFPLCKESAGNCDRSAVGSRRILTIPFRFAVVGVRWVITMDANASSSWRGAVRSRVVGAVSPQHRTTDSCESGAGNRWRVAGSREPRNHSASFPLRSVGGRLDVVGVLCHHYRNWTRNGRLVDRHVSCGGVFSKCAVAVAVIVIGLRHVPESRERNQSGAIDWPSALCSLR